MLTESLLACVGKQVNVVIGHRTPELLRGVLVTAQGNFIEVASGVHAKRVPLAEVRSIEVA